MTDKLWQLRASSKLGRAQYVPKKWGHEALVVTNTKAGYTGKILTVIPNGIACSVHYHALKVETFYVTKGVLFLELYPSIKGRRINKLIAEMKAKLQDGQYCRHEDMLLTVGDSLTIEPYTPHRFWAYTNATAEFIEFSTPDKPSDSYRIIEAGPR